MTPFGGVHSRAGGDTIRGDSQQRGVGTLFGGVHSGGGLVTPFLGGSLREGGSPFPRPPDPIRRW